MSQKKILLVIGTILILLAIPITVFVMKRNQDIRQRAAPATTLEFSPQSYTTTVGQQFTLDIIVNGGSNQIIGADLTVVFDPDILEAISIQKGNFLPNILVAGDIGAGSASIALGAPSTTPGTGTGTLATVSFVAQKQSTTPISIRFAQPDTQIIGIGEQENVLVGTTPAVITVNSGSDTGSTGGLNNPAPTAQPTASPSATTTTIIQPVEGETTSTQPVISGATFPNATITLTITGTTPLTDIVTATTTGGWSYTPATALTDGEHTVTITAQDPLTESVETLVRTFIVEGATTTASTSGIPVAGSIAPTAIIAGLGSVFLLFGMLAIGFSPLDFRQ